MITTDQDSQAGNTAKLRLAIGLWTNGMIKFGDFTLKSGKKSPIYIDLRELPSFPDVFRDATWRL